MSSPSGESGQSANTGENSGTPAVIPPVTQPVQQPVQQPAQQSAQPADNGRGSRELIASINALPEKIANVLLERSPVAQQNTPVPSSVGTSGGTGGASAGNAQPPGQGNATANAAPPPADAPTKKTSGTGNRFADWWFSG